MEALRSHGTWLLMVLMFAGCASSSGQLPINTSPHRLLAATKQLRAANSEAQDLPRELNKGVLPLYVIEPGDTLLVQPANLDSPVRLPTDQVVGPQGEIELGKYGQLQVVGKTTVEIRSDVEQIIAAHERTPVPITVSLIARQSKVFYVLGEVNSPGAYPLSGRETVLDAIIAAGGLTDSADQELITYVQPSPPNECRVVLPVCFREIVQMGDTATNYQIGPGDRVYVPSLTLAKQLAGMFRASPRPGCPPCGACQMACPEATPHHISPEASPSSFGETLPAPSK